MTMHLVFVSLALPVLSSTGTAMEAPSAAIEQRLEQASHLQKAGRDALRPVERALLLLADFEKDDAVFLGNDRVLPVAFDRSHYRPGRFGRGYYFEKARHNMLPPEVADVEGDIRAFQATDAATLAAVPADTAFGKKALAVSLRGAGDGVRTRAMPVRYRRRSWHEYAWTLMASAYVRGPKGAKIRVSVAFVPKAFKVDLKKKRGGKKPPPAIADQSTPQEVVLTGGWQRVACGAKSDCRAGQREAVFGIHSMGNASAAVLVDGLQFEQVAYYPHHHTMPTTWLPGGQSAPATSVRIGSPIREVFPVQGGGIAFWTMTPHESNLRKPGNTQVGYLLDSTSPHM